MYKYRFFLMLIVSILLCSCGSYTQPQVQHTYTTSTQDYHNFTALKINYEGGGFDSMVTQTLGAGLGFVGVKFKYFIDGRLVGSNNPVKSFQTTAQLPPGEHRLTIIRNTRALLAAGSEVTEFKVTYEFTLASGQVGIYKCSGLSDNSSEPEFSIDDGYGLVFTSYGFTNVESWKKLK